MNLNIRTFALVEVILLLWIFQAEGIAQETHHWETIIKPGFICRYLTPTSRVDANWTLPSYNDASWLSGPGGVGYGDDDDNTTSGPILSVYCRYDFTVRDLDDITELILDMDFDDGFVAYLNGTELARYNMGEAGSPTTWNQPSSGIQEASLYQDMNPFRFLLSEDKTDLLILGTNTFAVEVHNESISSSDLSSNAYLHAGRSQATTIYQTPPDWFYPPFTNDSTYLPLLVIDTDRQPIPNEPRITAFMKLIDRGLGNYNPISDPGNEYSGQISIETRGESSAWFSPKKSYSFETQTDSGENNNVSLLGLPEENDWVLYAPYSDKSLVRNVLTYELFTEMGNYAPRTRFVEVVVNNVYSGLYILTEKIKRDESRVDIAKLKPEDTEGNELTGGYLLRIDKLTGMGNDEFWKSPVEPPLAGFEAIYYSYFDPKAEELNAIQKSYIKDHLLKFEQALVSGNFKDPGKGYRAYLDIPSFIDIMILNEFVKDVDGFRLSHYFYKQKDSNGGKLVSGPPWDYNLAFGNSNYTDDIHETYNWVHTYPMTIYWWAKIMEDDWFRNYLHCRWIDLHKSVLSSDHLQNMIDSTVQIMGESIDRNFDRWPVLGTYIWPNSFVGLNYSEEEWFLRNWIDERLEWMDGKWGGSCWPLSTDSEEVIPLPGTGRIYPNPSDLSRTFVDLNGYSESELSFRLFDLRGRVVHQAHATYSGSEFAYALPNLSFLPSGLYSLEISSPSQERAIFKLIKQ
jgi:CotH kinase protein